MGDVYELAVHTKALNQRMVNVLYFEENSPPSAPGASAFDLATEWRTNSLPLFMAAKQGGVICDRITARAVRPNNALFHELLVSPAVIGDRDQSFQLMPLNCCIVISWRTPQAGGSHRGRTYLSGYTEVDTADGLWTGNALTAPAAFVTHMQTRYGNTGISAFRHSVWSRPYPAHTTYDPKTGTPKAWAAYAGQVTHVTGGLVRNVVYTQRRRTIGVGV